MPKKTKADTAKAYLLEQGHIPLAGYEGFISLCQAIENNATKVIRAYLDIGVDLNLHTDPAYSFIGQSPLVGSVKAMKLPLIKKLFQYGADPDALVQEQSPLTYAIAHKRLEVVELLLEQGASLDFNDHPKFRQSMASLCKQGHRSMLDRFFDYPPNQHYLQATDDSSLLIEVCRTGDIAFASYLLEKGVTTNLDLGDKTLLNYCAKNKKELSSLLGFSLEEPNAFTPYKSDSPEVEALLALQEEQGVAVAVEAITSPDLAYQLAQAVIYDLEDWEFVEAIHQAYPLEKSPELGYNLLRLTTYNNSLYEQLYPILSKNKAIIQDTLRDIFKYARHSKHINALIDLYWPHLKPSYTNDLGENPLHLLINTEYITIETLDKLATVYDPSAKDNFGIAALERASTYFNKELPQQFKQHFVETVTLKNIANYEAVFPLILGIAATNKRYKLIEAMLAQTTFNLKVWTPIFIKAVQANDLELVQFLLKKTTIDVSHVRRYGDSLLHLAKSKEMLEILVEKIDVNTPNKDFETPIFDCYHDRACVDLLLEKGALLTPYPAGSNFLNHCLWKDSGRYYEKEVPAALTEADIRYFLEQGADPNVFTPSTPSSYYSNAFIRLVEHKVFLELVLKTVEKPVINFFNNHGSSPLTTAINREEPELVKLLLDYGADWEARPKPKSKSAIELLLQKKKNYRALKAVFERQNEVFPLPEPEVRNPICTIEVIEDKPYHHALSPTPQTQVYRIAKEGDNPIVQKSKWKDISKLKIKGINNKLAFITQIDLTPFGFPTHRVPLFYHEVVSFDWVFAQLNEDNTIKHIEAYNGRDLCIGLEEEEFNEFEERYKLDKQFKNQFLTIHTIEQKATERLVDDYFGTVPRPIQNGFAIPKYKGEPMPFLGQYSAGEWGLADFEFYLFYNPATRVFAQLLQMT